MYFNVYSTALLITVPYRDFVLWCVRDFGCVEDSVPMVYHAAHLRFLRVLRSVCFESFTEVIGEAGLLFFVCFLNFFTEGQALCEVWDPHCQMDTMFKARMSRTCRGMEKRQRKDKHHKTQLFQKPL